MMKKDIEYVPVELVYRTVVSTGICAGNTQVEAFIHGICEIFERYAVKKIYKEELTPPTIPLDYFAGTDIYERIKFIENVRKKKVIIKDCSLGLNLPVIGVLVIDQQQNQYTFNLGSDPSPITAVERCISEMYQGGADIHFCGLHLNRDPFDTENGYTRDQNKQDQYYNTLFRGVGCWPNSIFSDLESYPFNGFEHSISESDEEDLAYVTGKVRELGFELYIRDVSFLGFPSCFVYVPGMSEGKFSYSCDFMINMEAINQQMRTFLNIKNSETKDIEKLAKAIEATLESSNIFEITKFFLHHNADFLKTMDPEIFLLLLFYRLEENKKAFKYLNAYLKKQKVNKQPRQLFHLCLRDYLKLKIENTSLDTIEKILMDLYGATVSRSVINDFHNPEKIFNNSALPECFNCKSCDIKPFCKHFDVLKVIKGLQEKYKKAEIDQLTIKKIFEDI